MINGLNSHSFSILLCLLKDEEGRVRGLHSLLPLHRKVQTAANKTITMQGSFEEPQKLPGPVGQASAIMHILMDISRWLQVSEDFIQEATKDKAAATTRR